MIAPHEFNNTNDNILRVFLIRHGQTNENKQKILQGHLNTSLSEEGQEQGRLLGARFLKDVEVDAFATSDLRRCCQTLSEVLKAGEYEERFDTRKLDNFINIADSNQKDKYLEDYPANIARMASKGEIYVSANLRERSFGAAEGMPIGKAIEWAEMHGNGKSYKQLGESHEVLRERLYAELNDLVCSLVLGSNNSDHDECYHNARTVKNFVIMSHGGAIRNILKHLVSDYHYNIHGGDASEIRVVYNTSITIVDFDKKNVLKHGHLASNTGCILKVGDTYHLNKQLEVEDQRLR